MSDIAIRHDTRRHRFEIEVEGHVGHVEYARHGRVLSIDHTIVPDAIGRRGIAGQLVLAAVEFARDEGLKIAPNCSYAAAWMDRHPEYASLRA